MSENEQVVNLPESILDALQDDSPMYGLIDEDIKLQETMVEEPEINEFEQALLNELDKMKKVKKPAKTSQKSKTKKVKGKVMSKPVIKSEGHIATPKGTCVFEFNSASKKYECSINGKVVATSVSPKQYYYMFSRKALKDAKITEILVVPVEGESFIYNPNAKQEAKVKKQAAKARKTSITVKKPVVSEKPAKKVVISGKSLKKPVVSEKTVKKPKISKKSLKNPVVSEKAVEVTLKGYGQLEGQTKKGMLVSSEKNRSVVKVNSKTGVVITYTFNTRTGELLEAPERYGWKIV